MMNTNIDIRNFSEVKDKIVMKLINTNANAEMLVDYPHEAVEDLAKIYMVYHKDENTNQEFTAAVNHDLLSQWNISHEGISKIAKENTMKHFPPQLEDMEQTLGYLTGDGSLPENLLEKEGQQLEGGMYVLTNPIKINGAIHIAFPEVLEKLDDSFPNGFYILPSSVHECIVVQKTSDMTASKLGEMVREVNATQLAPEEILSDRVYEFSKSDRCLRQMATHSLKQGN